MELFPEIFSNDYEVACYSLQKRGDYVDLLGKTIDSALVICGAQEHIGFARKGDGDYFLIKVEASESDELLEGLIKGILEREFVDLVRLNFEFEVKSSDMFLFDAGFTLSDAQRMDNVIEVDITAGRYATSLIRHEDNNCWLWIVHLSQILKS
jgi:hypothetical protein